VEFIIRTANFDDAEAISKIYAPYVLKTAVTFEYIPPAKEEFIERISNSLPMYPYLVAEIDGKVIGYSYASRFHKRAAFDRAVEVSIYLDENVRGGGIGRALYEKMEAILTAQKLCDMYVSIAVTEKEDEYLTNASPDFHHKMGFKDIALFDNVGYKFGRWYGLKWMRKILNEKNSDMPEILSFEDVKNSFRL